MLFIAFGLLAITLFSLLHIQHLSRAQGGSLELTKQLNKDTPVVRVGEVISFTIILTNNANFTLTNVTLVDQYNQNVLAFAGATPPQDLHDPASGLLTWTNVASPPIALGQVLSFTVFFTAEHPQTSVVNFVQAQDITGTGNAISNTQASDQIDESIGGMLPVFKSTSPPGSVPKVGQLVTFTHIITNDGVALLTFLPLTDTYDPLFLEFYFAMPTPTITSPAGLLVWTDLITYFGPISPLQSVVVTTVFTATAQVVNTVNQASIAGARDQFNNDLTASQALAPITIISDAPVPAPTDQNNDNDDDDDEEDTAAATATATPATVVLGAAMATPALVTGQSVLTGENAPRFLPETGYREDEPLALIVVVCLVGLAAGWVWLKAKR
jgi:uncharacterized repeat protein (TIGR01451 family)